MPQTVELEEYLELLGLTEEDVREAETIDQGHCCDCKYDDRQHKVWVCRVGNGISVEALIGGSWRVVAGDCME